MADICDVSLKQAQQSYTVAADIKCFIVWQFVNVRLFLSIPHISRTIVELFSGLIRLFFLNLLKILKCFCQPTGIIAIQNEIS